MSGCFICECEFIEDIKEALAFYAYKTDEQDYRKDNTVTLCGTCSSMMKRTDVISLLKQLAHIGSRLRDDIPNQTFFDAFISCPYIESYDRFTKSISSNVSVKCTKELYDRMCESNCVFL